MNADRLFRDICKIAGLTVAQTREIFAHITETAANAVLNAIYKVFNVESLTELSENLCNSFKNIVEDIQALNQRIDALNLLVTDKSDEAAPVTEPAPAAEIDTEAIANAAAIQAKQFVLDSDEFKRAVSAEVRELLGDIADAVREKNSERYKHAAKEKKPLIRQALPLAFKQLNWGEQSEASFAESAVDWAFKADAAKDLTTVEPIVKELVKLLPSEINKNKAAIVTILGYKNPPPAQADEIEIAACRVFITGFSIEDVIDEKINAGLLKKKEGK